MTLYGALFLNPETNTEVLCLDSISGYRSSVERHIRKHEELFPSTNRKYPFTRIISFEVTVDVTSAPSYPISLPEHAETSP